VDNGVRRTFDLYGPRNGKSLHLPHNYLLLKTRLYTVTHEYLNVTRVEQSCSTTRHERKWVGWIEAPQFLSQH